jgi:hypothetical protein
MKAPSLVKAGILTLILVITVVLSWEVFVRNKGFDTSYDDEPPLWADKRKMVYEPAEKATVFIGSSRIKFDLDINTWENITGDHAIQLASVGSSPRPVLEDLANDKKFKGKLLIDVTEGLFFSNAPNSLATPEENLKYYKDETPAQKASFQLNKGLESQLVFLDKDRLSLNALLARLRIPNRPAVFEFPIFPPDFGRSKPSRQDYMTDRFLTDTNQQNQVRGIWDFFRKMDRNPAPTAGQIDSILASVKNCTDKIRSRGGQVIFVRTPSSGPFLLGEIKRFPREQFWNRLLTATNCPGIHFSDYPAIAHFVCPEFSHLSQPDAILFTKNFIQILQEKGWKFSKISEL